MYHPAAIYEDRHLCGCSEFKLGQNTFDRLLQNASVHPDAKCSPPQLRYDYFLLCKSRGGKPIPSY